MPEQPWFFDIWTRRVDRMPYLVIGVVLFLVKYAIDWTIAASFGESWSPLNYLIWPNDRILRVAELTDPKRWFWLSMLLVSLPFIATGVLLTIQRLRSAELPLGLI